MRAELCIVAAALVLAGATPIASPAQGAADGKVLGARHVSSSAAFKVWMPSGKIRLVAWDRDSVLIRGRVAPDESFFFGGDSAGMKFGLEPSGSREPRGRSTLVAYLPRRARVSIKSVTADVDAVDVSGWFYSVSGSMRLGGAVSSLEVETMNGSLDLAVTTPWLRARTGDGHLLLRGAPEDVDVSTVAGTLDIATTTVRRGQFGTVSGDIHYVGAPARGAIMEFSSHSGTVELQLPPAVSGVFSLTSVAGAIENGLSAVRPAASQPHSMRLSLGSGGSQITVRTFKGTIRLRPQ
jgi:hypothetical protein